MNEENQFQAWLADLDDALKRFRFSLPPKIAGQLDFSGESLDVIEKIILDRYPTIEDTRMPSEAEFLDGAARYVGEVFRRNCGGKWTIDCSDEKFVFYGLPILDLRGQISSICPLAWVTASTDRRTGSYIRKVFNVQLKSSMEA